ncbi:hypothetical protein [Acaryochloris sp. CCMEE 5410]|uniref:hypothetical protein n=1 Tax=Acaryochloris sp. CCMEE 5410 TaxID=310037 RepID=UPI0002484FC6|nr:hypothetical protein [Acaryochloris sp. CCMEE 5410]KAI9134988.1 hypothetical protein ON05_018170 [Acaryochloris sp. CCMEE 5410]
MGALEDALELHKKLGTRYKEYETTDGEFPDIVVLNEMRYALRAAIKLLDQASFEHLSDEDRQRYDTSVQELHHALRNAYHDLVDGLLIQITRTMDALIEKYPVAAVNVLSQKRLEILEDLNKVEQLIAQSRGDGLNRQKLYDEEIYDGWFETIIKHYKFIDQVALDEVIREHDRIEEEKAAEQARIEAEQARKKKEEEAETRKFWLFIVLAILGIAVSTLGVVIAIKWPIPPQNNVICEDNSC